VAQGNLADALKSFQDRGVRPISAHRLAYGALAFLALVLLAVGG